MTKDVLLEPVLIDLYICVTFSNLIEMENSTSRLLLFHIEALNLVVSTYMCAQNCHKCYSRWGTSTSRLVFHIQGLN